MSARARREKREELFRLQNGCCAKCDTPLVLQTDTPRESEQIGFIPPSNFAKIKQIGRNTPCLACMVCEAPRIRTNEEINAMLRNQTRKPSPILHWRQLPEERKAAEAAWPPNYLKIELNT